MSEGKDSKSVEASFEDMTVSSTPGSPVRHEGQLLITDPAPNSKIEFKAEISYKDNVTKKSVRILATSSMHDFIDKLGKKKYIPSSCKSEQVSILYGKSKETVVPLAMSRWAEPLWNLGFRDKEIVLIAIDHARTIPHDKKHDSRPESDIKMPPEEKHDKHLSTFMTRFTRRSASAKEEAPQTLEMGGLLFGHPIEEVAGKGVPLMSAYGVPAFIEESFDFIKKFHTETEGVFRLSGSLTSIKALKKKIDSGTAPPFEDDVDVHCLTGLIKLYLRELPEPLLTYELFESWRAVVDCDIKEKKLELVKALLLALPKANYCLLKRLIEFFAELATFEGKTKMGLVNLATLIGPNLIWSPQKDSNDIATPMKITWFFLSNHVDLFTEADLRSTILLAVGYAKYDFTPDGEGEIHLKAGDIVFVTGNEEDSDGWLEGTTARSCEQGKFPSKYFEVVSHFSSFNPAVCHSSPNQSRSSSVSASSVNVHDELARLKSSLEGEIEARRVLEEKVTSLQNNFHDMVGIVITLKNRIKELHAIIEEMESEPYNENAPA